jgi:excisionase family DNA binding protein
MTVKTRVEPSEIYTLEEAAEYLKVTYGTVLRWAKQGTLPAFKVGRFWRVYGRDLLTLNKLGESEEEQVE